MSRISTLGGLVRSNAAHHVQRRGCINGAAQRQSDKAAFDALDEPEIGRELARLALEAGRTRENKGGLIGNRG